jgi:hypothetical protein
MAGEKGPGSTYSRWPISAVWFWADCICKVSIFRQAEDRIAYGIPPLTMKKLEKTHGHLNQCTSRQQVAGELFLFSFSAFSKRHSRATLVTLFQPREEGCGTSLMLIRTVRGCFMG